MISEKLDVAIREVPNFPKAGINFKDIEIHNDNFGKPSIFLKGSTANFLRRKIKTKKYSIYLSLSDDVPWEQATVIISYN